MNSMPNVTSITTYLNEFGLYGGRMDAFIVEEVLTCSVTTM